MVTHDILLNLHSLDYYLDFQGFRLSKTLVYIRWF